MEDAAATVGGSLTEKVKLEFLLLTCCELVDDDEFGLAICLPLVASIMFVVVFDCDDIVLEDEVIVVAAVVAATETTTV